MLVNVTAAGGLGRGLGAISGNNQRCHGYENLTLRKVIHISPECWISSPSHFLHCLHLHTTRSSLPKMDASKV